MSSLKTIITLAAVSATTLLGLLWLFKKKKPPARKKLFAAQDKKIAEQNKNSTNNHKKPDVQRDSNNSSEVVSISTSEQISAVLEPALLRQNVAQTSMKPMVDTEQLNNEPVVETISSKTCTQENGVPDDLVSQIVTDISPTPTCVQESFLKEDTSCNEKHVAIEESIKPESSSNVNISPENCSISESAQREEPLSQSSGLESKSMDQLAEKQKVENDVNVISNEDEPSPMSRSWHEDVEESEKRGTNSCSEQSEVIMHVSDSNKGKLPATNNHVNDAGGPARRDKRGLSNERTSKSPQSKNSSPVSKNPQQVKDEYSNNSESASNCDNSSEASNDSGKGGSLVDSHVSQPDPEKVFEFNIPTDMCGLFIGGKGKTVKSIRDQSGARIRLKNNPYTSQFQICVVEGTEAAINKACQIVKRKFPTITIPGIDTPTAVSSTVVMPEIMQLNLPEGVTVDVVVSSIVDAGRIFIQQPTHPTFPSLERLNSFMNQCYHHDGAVPDIPKPIESGVICAAPMLNGWYRAQIMVYYEDTDECDIKYVDYGGYSRISSQCLKQIRSDFMTLPFEAIECYLANVTPLENEPYFSPESGVVLEELTQGKMLQAQVVGKAEDGIPQIHLYQIGGNRQGLLVNRELVNRGVVRWLELIH